MAKWTGKIKRVKRWFRSDKLLVQMEKEEGDHNPPTCPPLYWEEVDGLRLDLIAFDLECRRSEIKILTAENKRLRDKLVKAGSDTKLEVTLGFDGSAEELAARLGRLVKETAVQCIKDHADWIRKPADVDLRTVRDCASRFAGGLTMDDGYYPNRDPNGAKER